MLFVVAGFFPLLCSAQVEKVRSWTNDEGHKVLAKILRVEENPRIGKIIHLEVSGKETRVPLSQLSKADREYVRAFELRQPVGEISDFGIRPSSDQREFLSAHDMHSYIWKGEVYGEELDLPFQLHIPPAEKREAGEKLPIVVHLHGTGGYGTGNVRPIFNDGGGIAKSYLGEDFQRYQACYVMIPQGNVSACWFGIGVTSRPGR